MPSPPRSQTSSPPRSQTSSPPRNPGRTTQYNVSLNRKTTLKTLYRYPPQSVVEYPETSSEGPIGHLFDLSPDNWSNPRLDFVYSQGEPSGRTRAGFSLLCELLVDSNGNKVPCREVHYTCMYKYYAIHSLRFPHLCTRSRL
jgi:hypothetical protein